MPPKKRSRRTRGRKGETATKKKTVSVPPPPPSSTVSVVELEPVIQEPVAGPAPARALTPLEVEMFPQKMWPLPFHDYLMTLIPRKELVRNPMSPDGSQRMRFYFSMTMDHANLIHAWPNATLFIRFCTASNPPELKYIEDIFPPGLELFLNGYQLELSAERIEFDRVNYSKPLELGLTMLSLNNVMEIRWNDVDPQKPYARRRDYVLTASFYIPVSPHDLCSRIVRLNPFIPKETTVAKSNEMLTESDGIAPPEDIKVSIKCPIVKKRIRSPSRGFDCPHQTCFDLFSFMKTYNHKFKLKCPICNRRLNIEDISIDSYLLEILKKLAGKENVSNIHVMRDGLFRYTEDALECMEQDDDFERERQRQQQRQLQLQPYDDDAQVKMANNFEIDDDGIMIVDLD